MNKVVRIDHEKLKLARQKAGKTQAEMCKYFNISIASYVNWERGVTNPGELIRPAVIKFIKEWSE